MPGLATQTERQAGLQSSLANGKARLNPGTVAFDTCTASLSSLNTAVHMTPVGIGEAREMAALLKRLADQIAEVHLQSTARDDELRKDIDQLKRGGWSVAVGPFQTRPFPGDVAPSQQSTACNQVLPSRPRAAQPVPSAISVDDTAAQLEGLLRSSDTAPKNMVRKLLGDDCNYKDEKLQKELDEVIASITDEGDGNNYSRNIPHKQGCTPDCPMPSVEDPGLNFVKTNSNWRPLAIRRLPSLPAAERRVIPGKATMKTFSWDFLQDFYGGTQWSPGFFYIPPAHGITPLPSRSWYGINATHEPYLPRSPGDHGAKLTAFFNTESPEDIYDDEGGSSLHNVPLFISASSWASELPEKEFIYFGMYSQLRFSDKLDYDRMVESVPHHVKMYWAEQLSDPGRPEWVTKQLKNHFMPKPVYEGNLPGPDVDSGIVRTDFAEYRRELLAWENDASMVAASLSTSDILQAFEQEDANEPHGLRLWWEYLQCIGWDPAFYHMLLKAQAKHLASSSRGAMCSI